MNTATDLLSDALILVLERVSFLYPTSPFLEDFDPYNPGQTYESLDELLLATVDSDCATICLWVPIGLGMTVAANMLGTDPNDPYVKDRIADAAGELTNMVAGLVVNSQKESPKLEMTVPSFHKPDYFEALVRGKGLDLVSAVSFFVEEYRISGALCQKNDGVGLP